jgi:alkylation response protein AidB-like acyl-CoA dehydrogenase
MSFELPTDALEWQARVRTFVDKELIPWEVEAELNGGEIPAEVRARHCAIAQDLGLPAMDVSQERGGLGLCNVTQVAIYEELGRVTNALGWCFSEAHRWMFEACSEDQIARYVMPIMVGERHECYAITGAESGSDVEGIAATARRDGDNYVLNGEKWYVTSANFADFCVFQAKIAGGPHAGAHALFFVDLDSPGIEMVASPLFSHTYAHHHPTYLCLVPPRAPDDRRALLRRGSAPDRRGDRLRQGAPGLRRADRRLPGDPVHAGRQRYRALGGTARDL